jgi:dTDP-4-amino-4,6-dideoxygalactose transaminase
MYQIGDEEVAAVRRVIESGRLFRYRGGEGGETDTFEREWAAFTGTGHALAVVNGTAALECALAGLGVGPGDEVIVPAYTWMATATAALAVGAIPVIADVDESLLLDPADVERRITPRTRVICPVHMVGLPCDMDAITAVADKHGLLVLEDACQAAGGSYRGRSLGSIGAAGAFSFNHFKIIACGEGGAVVTDDTAVYHGALIHHDAGCGFRDHAGDLSVPVYVGRNYRLNEILSAILRVQLTRLPGILAALRAEKRIMVAELAEESAFRLNPVNDVDGDCAVVTAAIFETRPTAEAFIAGMAAKGFTLESPIDTGRHVYTNWAPVLEQRGAHHPGRDPFKQCGYEIDYTEEMCATTLDLLGRTVFIPTAVDRPKGELTTLIRTVKTVANSSGVAV